MFQRLPQITSTQGQSLGKSSKSCKSHWFHGIHSLQREAERKKRTHLKSDRVLLSRQRCGPLIANAILLISIELHLACRSSQAAHTKYVFHSYVMCKIYNIKISLTHQCKTISQALAGCRYRSLVFQLETHGYYRFMYRNIERKILRFCRFRTAHIKIGSRLIVIYYITRLYRILAEKKTQTQMKNLTKN